MFGSHLRSSSLYRPLSLIRSSQIYVPLQGGFLRTSLTSIRHESTMESRGEANRGSEDTERTMQGRQNTRPSSSAECMKMEHSYGARNYHPMPVVFSEAKGVHVWDPEGRQYYDFLAAYSAVNQGHCHPRIVDALVQQASRLTLSSRAFYNDAYAEYAQFVTQYFGYDMVLPMNTGVEAVETSFKLARKWAYVRKGVPFQRALIIHCCGSFHGRSMTAITMSCDPSSQDDFGPFLPGVVTVSYNDVEQLRAVLERVGHHVAAFIVEPIQGEAGVVVPDDGYLKQCYDLCKKHNVLFIADEVQTGIARTGKMLCSEWDGIRPDVVVLGKAISGGLYPVSAVLADREILEVIEPGTHGSTYGGNPLGCAVAVAALQVVRDENLVEKSLVLGEKFRNSLKSIDSPLLETVRGRGLMNAIVIRPHEEMSAWELCILLKHRGLLCKPTHENIIRLTPPLVITEEQLDECSDIIRRAIHDLPKLTRSEIPDVDL